MQAHVLRIGAVETVAVDAALKLGVIDQRTLLEAGQVTLVDAHLAPHLVAGLDQTVAEAVVDAVGTDIDGERFVCMPAVLILRRDDDRERIPAVLSKQRMPFVNIEVRRLLALGMQATAVAAGNDGIDAQCRLVCHVKAQRGDVHGNGDADIVGINPRLCVLLSGIADGLGAGHQQQHSANA